MPKQKTHSSAKKRFKITGKGKFRGRHAMTSHYREVKSRKRQRRLAKPHPISAADRPRVRGLLRK